MNTQVMRSFFLEVAGTLILGISSSVLADTGSGSKWYVEARIDNASSSLELDGFFVDDDEAGWQIGGGYSFNRYFSLQANYHDFGNGHFATSCPPPLLCLVENTDRVDIDGLSMSAIGTLPITDVIDVYARFGILRWEADFDRFDVDKSGADAIFGAGVGLNLASNWRLSLQYDTSAFDVDSAGLAVTYRPGSR